MADDSSTEKSGCLWQSNAGSVRNEIAAVQQQLQVLLSPDAVRWTKPEQFHLTLRFLGAVSAERVTTLQEAVSAACLGKPALRLRAQGAGFSRMPGHARHLAGVNDGEGRLAELQEKIEGAVQPFTKEPGTERFAGHVTIGRVKFLKRHEIEKLAAHAQAVKDRLFGQWTANEVELIRSDLLPGGACHTLLAKCRLAK